MKELESIDVTSSSSSSSSSSSDDVDDDVDDETMLAEAQREADEADAMLKQAEEEAAMWERELAELEAAEEATSSANDDDDDALESMAEAYQAALDAANDNVDLLSAQIRGLEEELSSTVSKMEKSEEDKERIGAEYAFLAKNYGELKNKKDQEDGQSSSSKSVKLLEEEIEGYRVRAADLESRLGDAESRLGEARDEADAAASDRESALAELRACRGKGRGGGGAGQNGSGDSEFEGGAEGTGGGGWGEGGDGDGRRGGEGGGGEIDGGDWVSGNSFVGSFLHPSSRVILSARGAAVETARCSTNLAYLTSSRCRFFPVATLPIPHPKTNSSLRRSLEEEQSRSVRSAADYEARIAAYADQEKALLGDLKENERAASNLARERDESAKRAEVLRLELEVLESKVRDRDAEEMSTNAHLQKMLADSRASFERETSAMEAMESKLADTGTRIASLEEELDTKRKVAFAAERALEKTRSNLVDVRGRYDEEAATGGWQRQRQRRGGGDGGGGSDGGSGDGSSEEMTASGEEVVAVAAAAASRWRR